MSDMYPSATSDSTKIKYLNMAQDELSDKFGLVVTDTTLLTRANDDEYALPTGIEDISQIETFDIASAAPVIDKLVTATNMIVGAYTLADQIDYPKRVSITHITTGATDTLGTITLVGISGDVSTTEVLTPVADSTIYSTGYYSEVTSLTGASWVTDGTADTISIGVKPDRYDTVRYKIGYKDDKPMQGNCIYQNYSSAGVKSLVIYPAPSLAGLPITIRYHAKLADLSQTNPSASPQFDDKYHTLLATYACYQICANGPSPDSVQANRFSAAYEEGYAKLLNHDYQQKIIAPRKHRDNKMWHRR